MSLSTHQKLQVESSWHVGLDLLQPCSRTLVLAPSTLYKKLAIGAYLVSPYELYTRLQSAHNMQKSSQIHANNHPIAT